MEKIREDFEAWYSAKYQIAGAWCDTAYAKELAFDAWQQSRAAQCVKLPRIGVLHHSTTYSAPELRQALDAVGVNYF